MALLPVNIRDAARVLLDFWEAFPWDATKGLTLYLDLETDWATLGNMGMAPSNAAMMAPGDAITDLSHLQFLMEAGGCWSAQVAAKAFVPQNIEPMLNLIAILGNVWGQSEEYMAELRARLQTIEAAQYA